MDLGPENIPEVAWVTVCGEKEHEVAWVCGEVQAGRAPAGSAAAPVSAFPVIHMVLAFANSPLGYAYAGDDRDHASIYRFASGRLEERDGMGGWRPSDYEPSRCVRARARACARLSRHT